MIKIIKEEKIYSFVFSYQLYCTGFYKSFLICIKRSRNCTSTVISALPRLSDFLDDKYEQS